MPEYTLEQFPPEEGTAVAAAIDKTLAEHSAQLVVQPIINPNGTLGAVINIAKRVPKESVGETPNGTENSDKTSEEAEPKTEASS